MYIAYIMHLSVYSVRTLYKNLLCAQHILNYRYCMHVEKSIP